MSAEFTAKGAEHRRVIGGASVLDGPLLTLNSGRTTPFWVRVLCIVGAKDGIAVGG